MARKSLRNRRGNNRIMVWNGIPNTNGQACDFVLGQANMTDVDHNQSLYWPRSNTLNMPYAISSYGKWLIAADTASSRLVAWSFEDLQTNASATALLGQPDFHEKGDNRYNQLVQTRSAGPMEFRSWVTI